MKKPPGIHAEPGCRDHFCVTRKLTSLFGADFDERAKLSITGVGPAPCDSREARRSVAQYPLVGRCRSQRAGGVDGWQL